MLPPVAPQIPHSITSHGETRTDPYFWLREKDNPAVTAYLEQENTYTDEVMRPTQQLQETLYQEILGRIKETDLSVPARKGDYFYYSRTEQGQQYPIHCRKKGSLDAPEEVLLDANTLAAEVEYFRLGNFSVSPNQQVLAYSTENAGDETYTLFVKDLATGGLLREAIPNTYYGLAWARDNQTFFYITLDEAKRPYRLYRHVLGTPHQEDVLVYEEPDQRFLLSVGKTNSEQFLLLGVSSHTTSEMRYLPSDQPAGDWQLIAPRQPDIEYYVEHQGGFFYFRTNDGGRNFRLMRAPLTQPAREHWEEVVPHRPDTLLEAVEAFAQHLVLHERQEGLTRLRVQNTAAATEHYIEYPEPVYTVGTTGNLEFQTKTLRFQYTSLITPDSIFDYDMEARTRELKKQTEVLGGYDPSLYASERIFATAPDGVRVPLSLVYKKELVRDGQRPCFLYGYGSYGIVIDPEFSSARLSLLDRGFLFAIAHIRGGADLGKPWHDQGRLLHKKNTFTDFIACAEHLIQEQYTSPTKLVISGGSAGGLLMGAVLNQRPDLFRAAIAAVPFVDVLNTMEDATLPLTVGEYEEWGNPAEKPYYDYIRSYSPYDNVQSQEYPRLLVRAGLNDPRVSYWEPAKWTAKLRTAKTDKHLLLLKTEMGAGHGGPSGRYNAYRERAFDYAFFLHALER